MRREKAAPIPTAPEPGEKCYYLLLLLHGFNVADDDVVGFRRESLYYFYAHRTYKSK